MVADYKALCMIIRKAQQQDETWRLEKDKHGEFCCFCPAIRQCTCSHPSSSTPMNPLLTETHSCEAHTPFVKSSIRSDKFCGIRNNLCNLLGIPIEDVLFCILHGNIRVTGIYIFLSKFN